MVKNMDELQQFGKDNMDATMKSLGTFSKSWQAIAAEMAEYSKKVFEQGTAATEKLLGAKSFEKAVEVQTEYTKSAYEGFVAEATKLGELYSDLAREMYRPYESQFGKSSFVK
ncbi:MAG: phasin family protein [Xanthobacteraceae bacterium]